MIPGITVFISNKSLTAKLRGKRVAFFGNEASVDKCGRSSMSLLGEHKDIHLVCAFGPQHGFYGEKQDNMIESDDFHDHDLGIPVFSLYGKVRRPTPEMMDHFDVLVVDLQDLGVRVYTYVTTLFYLIDACHQFGKALWILDRPNPSGRQTEGLMLEDGWESFIGPARMIMQYGLTLAELASWYIAEHNYTVDLLIVKMEDYDPGAAPGYGWPVFELPWVNPSPNASGLNMARCYPGTCLIEGTNLSEGRGTTHPLEMVGAPGLDFKRLLDRMKKLLPGWTEGAVVRLCHFEPVFDKHTGSVCTGIQIHTDSGAFDPQQFKPFRLMALMLKAIRLEYPEYSLWRYFMFEYETERMAIDLLSGSDFLRRWTDDPGAETDDLEKKLTDNESEWIEITGTFRIY
ncbi:MAG: DUF1343 domain-containing protein [Chlorobi bacterium]|nr:DUF1343 domain-containing protein [Chlorobiota bacterium]